MNKEREPLMHKSPPKQTEIHQHQSYEWRNLFHDQRYRRQKFLAPPSPYISIHLNQSVPLIPTPTPTSPPTIPTSTPALLLRVRIPCQSANDCATQRSDTGSQKHVTNDTARASAEEAIARLVRLFLLVFLLVVVVVVFVWAVIVVIVEWLLLVLLGRV